MHSGRWEALKKDNWVVRLTHRNCLSTPRHDWNIPLKRSIIENNVLGLSFLMISELAGFSM